MKDKLEVGMYVRTETGQIGKITNFDGSMARVDTDKFITYKNFNSEITKASHNIIDLIEENDFINGLRVEKNKYGELYTSYVYYGGGIGKQCEVYTTWLKEYTEDMIENIVTREQFNSVKYEVK